MKLQEENAGIALGLLGVVIFSLTMPMTRLAVGGADGAPLPADFVTAGRAAGAAVLWALYLLLARAQPPRREHLDAVTVLFAVAVMGVFLVGRNRPVARE